MGKSFDVRFESQPTPDVKIVLHECRSGEVKVWQAAVAEGWNFRESRFSGRDDGSGSQFQLFLSEILSCFSVNFRAEKEKNGSELMRQIARK